MPDLSRRPVPSSVAATPCAVAGGRHGAVPARLRALLLLLWLAFAAAWQPARAQGLFGGAVVTTEHVRAELVAHAPEGVAAGRTVRLGLLMRHRPEWHSYWKNPGDSGLPTTFAWRLPPGVEAGDIEWPTPKPLPVGPLVNYGYDGEVLLPVTLKLPEGFAAAALDVALHAEWLVCKDVCIPESGDFRLRLPAQAATAVHAAPFEAARAARPREGVPGVRAKARVDAQGLAVEVAGLPAAWRGGPLQLFVEEAGVVDPAARVAPQWSTGGSLALRVPFARDRYESPTAMHAVLAPPATPPGSAGAIRVAFDVAGTWPAPVSLAAGHDNAAAAPLPGAPAPVAGQGGANVSPQAAATATAPRAGAESAQAIGSGGRGGPGVGGAPQAGTPPAQGTQSGFPSPAGAGSPGALVPASPAGGTATAPSSGAGTAPAPALLLSFALAFAGGLLLNLMPCVFPILSLKVLGFARQRPDRRALAAGGVAYSLGVVLSFLALAALLLALRAGGEQLGWGFQLQSPPFVAALAALFTLIGLNLAGVFELRGVLPGGLATLRARHPLADQALTGVLAVAVASPCSAPFMGAALGAALAQPTAGALAIFGALGLGMAAPYLAASLWPGLADRLPRPGAWMARFKTLMAFPMFATVVWLVWVLGRQVGIDGAAALLGVLLALAFAGWALLGLRGLRPAGRTAFGALGVLALGAALAWAWPSWREVPAAGAAAGAGMPVAAGRGDAAGAAAAAGPAARWRPWSPAAVADAQRDGRTVFVDFTAAWCVTCQVNKRFTLADAGLLADFDARRVLLLRADWTRRDPAITQALAALGRNGVPVYALYPPGGGAPAVLSELLSVAEVRQALGRL